MLDFTAQRRAALARTQDDPETRAACEAILDRMAEAPSAQMLRMLTWDTLAGMADVSPGCQALLKAVTTLSRPDVGALEPVHLLMDQRGDEFEIDPEDMEEARREGALGHPETGELIDDFEQCVVTHWAMREEGPNAPVDVPSVYLAGPEVFLEDPSPAAISEAKKRMCEEVGLAGHFPFDCELDLSGKGKRQAGFEIGEANLKAVEKADAVIANLTPFRGPSADVGTVAEIAYAVALGKPVVGYTNANAVTYAQRAPSDGMTVEDFDLFDNLMLPALLRRANAEIVCQPDVPESKKFTDLRGFRMCAVKLANRLL